MLQLKANKKLVQHIASKGGRVVLLLKDVHNVIKNIQTDNRKLRFKNYKRHQVI